MDYSSTYNEYQESKKTRCTTESLSRVINMFSFCRLSAGYEDLLRWFMLNRAAPPEK